MAFIVHCEITLHVSGALCTHHQEYIKTVDAVTGTSHVSVGVRLNPLKDIQVKGKMNLSLFLGKHYRMKTC